MRILADRSSHKLNLFGDLVTECQLSAPGYRLSDKLRRKMEEFGRDDRREVACQMTTAGCAPLFLACRNGSADVVEYLITTCGADIEQRGQFEVLDEGVSHSVTPLWCAAVSGRLAVVKTLISHGADVNAVSDSGSTPIRSTCYIVRPGNPVDNGTSAHYDIVKVLVRAGADIGKANHFGGTCLINSVQSPELVDFLLKNGRGFDINAADIQHKTALHYAVQENRLESTKLLLRAGADPLRLSKYGDDALQTACLKGSLMIFNYLLEKVVYDPQTISSAFELMGSTFLLDLHDVGSTMFFWRKAMEMRHEGSVEYPKEVASEVHPVLGVKEVNTLEEFEEMAGTGDSVSLKKQALLMSERILGATHKDTIFRFMYAGAAHADANEYKTCVALWNHALDLKVNKETLLSSDTSFTARAIVQLYINILVKTPAVGAHDPDDPGDQNQLPLTFEDALVTAKHLNRGMKEAKGLLVHQPQFQSHLDNFDIVLTSWIHLIHILLRLSNTYEQKKMVFQVVDDALSTNPVTQAGDTVLHLAVASSSMLKSNSFLDGELENDRLNGQNGNAQETVLQTPLFPSEPVTRFVLTCGYDVHARNDMQETPLHIACRLENFNPKVAKTLLDSGAHLDTPDLRDISPQDVLTAAQPHCKFDVMPYVSLKCLAANVILRERVSFTPAYMPRCLQELIEIHVPNLPNLEGGSQGNCKKRRHDSVGSVVGADSGFNLNDVS